MPRARLGEKGAHWQYGDNHSQTSKAILDFLHGPERSLAVRCRTIPIANAWISYVNHPLGRVDENAQREHCYGAKAKWLTRARCNNIIQITKITRSQITRSQITRSLEASVCCARGRRRAATQRLEARRRPLDPSSTPACILAPAI